MHTTRKLDLTLDPVSANDEEQAHLDFEHEDDNRNIVVWVRTGDGHGWFELQPEQAMALAAFLDLVRGAP